MDATGNRSNKLEALNARLSGGLTVDAIDPSALSRDGSDAGNSGGSDSGIGSGAGSGGSAPAVEPTAKRKRGRPPGSGSGKSTSKARDSVSADGLEKILFSIHLGLASVTKNADWALDHEEAKMLAESAKAVADHYNFEASKEVMLWTNLCTSLAMVYGPRIVKTVQATRKKPEKPRPVSAANEPIVPAPVPSSAVSNAPSIDLPANFDPTLYAHLGDHG